MKKLALATTLLISLAIVSCAGTSKDKEKKSGTTVQTETKKVENNKTETKKMGTIHLTKEEFLKKVVNYETNSKEWKYLGDKPCLIDFYADWCAPCRMMAPILQQVAKEMDGKVKIVKVNVDKNSDAARKYMIRSIPTMILFKKGEVKWQGVGVMQADQIKSIIEQKS